MASSTIAAKIRSSRQICGYCGTPVVRHSDAHEDAQVGKPPRLFHLKKCWPKEKRRRHKARRLAMRQEQRKLAAVAPDTSALLEVATPIFFPPDREPASAVLAPPPPDPIAEGDPVAPRVSHRIPDPIKPIIKNISAPHRPSRFQGRRGLITTIETILDGITGYFSTAQVLAELSKRGLTTTLSTIATTIWSYGKKRNRPYRIFRHQGQTVYEFLPTAESAPSVPSEPIEAPQPLAEPSVQFAVPPEPEPPPPSRADAVDRMLNDFQAIVLDMVVQLKGDLRRLLT